jgi:hypothetical protein
LGPGYSMEPHSVLDHIWQSYVNDKGVPVRLSAQVYYTTFLNAIQSFYDLEEYPINIAGVFMGHIDWTFAKSFRVHYPDYGQVCNRSAVVQHRILTKMLRVLLKVETDVSNILEIVGVDKRGGEQFYFTPPAIPAYPSIAERTISSYTPSGDDDVTKVYNEDQQ